MSQINHVPENVFHSYLKEDNYVPSDSFWVVWV